MSQYQQAYANLRKIYINLENPCTASIRINLILPESRVIGYIFVACSIGLSSFKFSWWAQKVF